MRRTRSTRFTMRHVLEPLDVAAVIAEPREACKSTVGFARTAAIVGRPPSDCDRNEMALVQAFSSSISTHIRAKTVAMISVDWGLRDHFWNSL